MKLDWVADGSLFYSSFELHEREDLATQPGRAIAAVSRPIRDYYRTELAPPERQQSEHKRSGIFVSRLVHKYRKEVARPSQRISALIGSSQKLRHAANAARWPFERMITQSFDLSSSEHDAHGRKAEQRERDPGINRIELAPLC
jgi:hypothetical protein